MVSISLRNLNRVQDKGTNLPRFHCETIIYPPSSSMNALRLPFAAQSHQPRRDRKRGGGSTGTIGDRNQHRKRQRPLHPVLVRWSFHPFWHRLPHFAGAGIDIPWFMLHGKLRCRDSATDHGD